MKTVAEIARNALAFGTVTRDEMMALATAYEEQHDQLVRATATNNDLAEEDADRAYIVELLLDRHMPAGPSKKRSIEWLRSFRTKAGWEVKDGER